MSKMNSSSLVIAKFGGTSVADFDAMIRCVKIVKANSACRLVVTSAPAGITDLLVNLATGHLSKQQIANVLNDISKIANSIIEQITPDPELTDKLNNLLSDVSALAGEAELPSRLDLKDQLLSFGERIASLLLTSCFQMEGITAQEFDVRDVMATDGNFGAANPDLDKLASKCQQYLAPQLHAHVLITQGFIGKTDNGQTTTLGRGGSDYSAALLSEALKASRCEIWTDVAGVFSTDPRIVNKAYALSELSYDEAAEMANFGAKVLHPATLAPTLRHDIPVFVGSTQKPEQGGTTIVRNCQQEPTFRAITRRREQKLITLHTPKLERSAQFIGKVFAILDKHGLSIDLITTSETFIALTLNAPVDSNLQEGTDLALTELRQICIVETTPQLDLITIVGNNLHSQEGGPGKIFEVLEDVRVRMICYGANPHNISFLVDEYCSTAVIQQLHGHLLENIRATETSL